MHRRSWCSKGDRRSASFATMVAALAGLGSPLGCGSSEEAAPNTQQDAGSPPTLDAAVDASDEEEVEASADVVWPPANSGICSWHGWCWEIPTPQGNDLYAVWASDAAHLFAVGQLGTLLEFDGRSWSIIHFATRDPFRAVWGSGRDDVWAAGDRTALAHFNGAVWSDVPLPDEAKIPSGGAWPKLSGIAGTSKTDVWAVGEAGTILHFDGTQWSVQNGGTSAMLRAAFAAAADDVWAVGDGGVVHHFDGRAWTATAKTGITSNLYAVHGTARDDVWVAGAQGVVGHYDGTKWTRVVVETTTAALRTLVAESPSSVWAAADNGAVWHMTSSPADPSDGGDAATDAADARRDAPAPTWTKVPSGAPTPLYGAWKLGIDDVCFVGAQGHVSRWNAGRWLRMGSGSAANRLAVAASSADDIWITGDETIRRAKNGWSTVPAATERALYGLAYTRGAGGWAVGTAGTILRLEAADGGSAGDAGPWTVVESPSTRWLRAVWMSGSSAGWIVGGAGTALALLNGAVWQPVPPAGVTVDLFDVWGAAIDDVWAVGQGGTILHWRSSGWALASIGAEGGATTDLRGIWGSAAKDIWAVGAQGTILHYNGTVWSTSAASQTYTLNDVWGSSATDVYAVGTSGTILHYDGTDWTPQRSPTDRTLNAIAGSEGRIFVVGEGGTVLRRERP